jgi:predicted HTH transcriptional regulator
MSRIRAYIAEGEHDRQDFKLRIDDSRKIAKTLSAFANTRGGRILVGVKDNGAVAGTDPEQEYHMIEGAAKLYCRPEPRITYNSYTLEGRQVLEAIVEPTSEKPLFAETAPGLLEAFERVGDENVKANRVRLLVWADKTDRQPGELLTYTAVEERIFQLLETSPGAGFKKIVKHGKLSSRRAEQLLAKLIAWGLVEMRHGPAGHRFYATNPETKPV